MRPQSLSLTIVALALAQTLCADNTQTVTIGGEATGKEATQLAFGGDNVTLTYADGTTQTEDISLVSITLGYSTAVEAIKTADGDHAATTRRIYTLDGQFVGSSLAGLPKGIYIVDGKKHVID